MCPRFFCVSSLLPEAVGAVGKWEPLFGFHFSTGHISASFSRSSPPIQQQPERWECGNLAPLARFPGSRGKNGNPAFGFPFFPHSGISTARPPPASRFILFPFHRPAETERFRSRFDDVSPVRYAVQQCFA